MRTMHMLAVALMTVLAATPPATAQDAGATDRSGWVTHLFIQRIEDGFLERPETARLVPQREGGWTTFTRTNEMPADLAARPFTHDSFVVVDVSSAGHATGCRPLRTSAEPRLDALACRLLMRPEYFNAYLIPVDPAPAPAQWAIGLRFETMDTAEAAERQTNTRNVLTTLGFPPPIRVAPSASAPPVRATGVAAPEAAVSTGPRRAISGHLVASVFDGIADRTITEGEFLAELEIDTGGVPTACRVARSSGNAAVDRRTCEFLMEHARYTLRADVAGNLISDTFTQRIDLGWVLRQSQPER